MKPSLVAPCGMNCGVCSAYLRKKNHCPGCRIDGPTKPLSCIRCKIKNCAVLKKSGKKFCNSGACEKFPCPTLAHLDKRYKEKYHMSMLENLGNIKKSGIKKFVKNEKTRWACKKCGGTICVHKHCCFECGTPFASRR
ncbi:MAG: DUF3795 domain-containing protein [Candidatus Micrarchaeia archaeon]